MSIGLLKLHLFFPNTFSLKDKRSILSKLKNILRKQYNISIAEVGKQNSFRDCDLAIAHVSNDSSHIHKEFSLITKHIENHFDVQIVKEEMEIL
jgi:uncharacterized protein YlxP (DUF503 family)